MKQRTLIYCMGLLTLLLMLMGCERRVIEVEYSKRARVLIRINWVIHFNTKPSGMTVMIFPMDGRPPMTEITNNVDSLEVTLEQGRYRIVAYSLTTEEYEHLRFQNLDSWDEANVTTRINHTSLVGTRGPEDFDYMEEPEEIQVAVSEQEVTEEMIIEQHNFMPYDEWKDVAYEIGSTPSIRRIYHWDLEPKPMTTMLHVRVKLKGARYAKALTGSLTGMADGFMLTDAWRRENTGRVLLSGWNISYTDYTHLEGWLSCDVPVFGLPHGKEHIDQRKKEDNQLNLYFTLNDGSTKALYYYVGKKLYYEDLSYDMDFTRGDVTRHLWLVIGETLEDPNPPYIPPNPDIPPFPSDPIDPEDPKQTDPEDPEEPGKPSDPADPLDPTDPDNPVDPEDPRVPEPEMPEVPDAPDSGQTTSGFDAEVAPWEDGGTVDIGM